MSDNAKWYVIHTYSGYENKVKANIEKIVENRGLSHLIHEIQVPMEKVIEKKGEESKEVMRKVFPGYVIIKMEMTDESWYIVRNTRGVTGFVGPESKPVPLTEEEVKNLGVEISYVAFEGAVGDSVRITSGPFESFVVTIDEILSDREKIKAAVTMFGGRETVVELDFDQVELLD